MAASKARWPLGRGFERFYGFLGGESSCWYPDLVHDNHQIDAPRRRRRDTNRQGPVGPGDPVIRDAKVGTGQAVLRVSVAGCPTRLTMCTRRGGQVQRPVRRRVIEAIRAGILSRQKDLGLLPDDTELSSINPHGEPAATGPDGQPWRAGHGPAVGVAERRREAAFHPDGRGVRRVCLLQR